MTTDQQLESFRAALDAANAAHYAKEYPGLPLGYFGGVTVERGPKNARFVIESGATRSVLLFVELETGNILKAAGWKAPAKGVRGNIATTEPRAGTGWLYR
jgi:hypothetical protein